MIIIYSIFILYLLWFFFLAVINLFRAYKFKTLSKSAKILGYPILVAGALLDFFVNFTFGTLIFIQFPKQMFLTQRMASYLKLDNWRGKISRFVCTQLLDPFDLNGIHCK